MIIFYSIFLFLLGTVLGSFYGVVGSRLPKNESIINPGSHCEYCSHELKWYELIPIISFLIQKGKCRNCHRKLSLSYIAAEIFTGILFVCSYLKFGFTYDFYISVILSSLVILIFVSDMKYMIILDSPLIVSGILIFVLQIIFLGWMNALESLLSGFIVFLVMFAVGRLGDFLFKKESLGGGDIKLSFIIGLALGHQLAFVALILSTFLALPYSFLALMLKRGHEVPFGPFLVSALWIVFYFMEKFNPFLTFLLNFKF